MLGKYYNPNRQHSSKTLSNQESPVYGLWRERLMVQREKKQYRKKLFGQHYNYSLHGLNKEKKYMLEEQRNTEVQRANRILFQKLQKIGQRGTKTHKSRRVYFEQTEMSEIQSKPSRVLPQNDSPNSINFSPLQHLKKTIQNKTKYDQFYELSKTSQLKNKVLFYGYKQIDEKMLLVTITIDKDHYVIKSQNGNMQHKIQMDLKDYKELLRDTLKGDHMNIFELLKFNGTILELEGGQRQQVKAVQHEELLLPAVNQNFTSKKRTYTS